MTYNDIVDLLLIENPEALLADGFEDALVGIVQQFTKSLAMYDIERCLEILMIRDGMSEDEALEHMDYNVLGSWVGENTPIFSMIFK